MKTYFVDAQEMAQLHPDTFESPTTEELNQIEEGTYVKVCNEHERFWMEVNNVDDNKITATVSNNLLGDYGYDFGDVVEFEKRHVYSIL